MVEGRDDHKLGARASEMNESRPTGKEYEGGNARVRVRGEASVRQGQEDTTAGEETQKGQGAG